MVLVSALDFWYQNRQCLELLSVLSRQYSTSLMYYFGMFYISHVLLCSHYMFDTFITLYVKDYSGEVTAKF